LKAAIRKIAMLLSYFFIVMSSHRAKAKRLPLMERETLSQIAEAERAPEKSPTQTVTTRTNHLFASRCGFVKLELLKGQPNSTTSRSNPNFVCTLCSPLMPCSGNSIPLAWRRKVSV
jgi:hypothetical protein